MLFPLNENAKKLECLDSVALYFDFYGLELKDCSKIYSRSDLKKIAELMKSLDIFKRYHIIQKFSLLLHERVFNDFLGMIPKEILEDSMVSC